MSIILISLVTTILMRFLIIALPEHLRWQEQNWLRIDQMQAPLIHPLSKFKIPTYFKVDDLWLSIFCACLLISYYFHMRSTENFIWLISYFFVCVLMMLAIIDCLEQVLPDVVTLSLVWIGLSVQIFPATQTVGLANAVKGAIIGYLILWIPSQLFFWFKKQQGIGYGDMKLISAIGSWMGWESLFVTLFFSFLLVIACQLPALLMGKNIENTRIPFAPFIVCTSLLGMPNFLNW